MALFPKTPKKHQKRHSAPKQRFEDFPQKTPPNGAKLGVKLKRLFGPNPLGCVFGPNPPIFPDLPLFYTLQSPPLKSLPSTFQRPFKKSRPPPIRIKYPFQRGDTSQATDIPMCIIFLRFCRGGREGLYNIVARAFILRALFQCKFRVFFKHYIFYVNF